MTNYDRALAVLESARRPGDLRIHPNDAVEALAQAGLIAPDLPKCPDDGVWGELGQFLVDTAENGGVAVAPPHPGVVTLTSKEARETALDLLAAADYKEEA